MIPATQTEGVGDVLPVEYLPDRVEVLARRLKMEYVGMASVFLTIWVVNFHDASRIGQSCLATLASFFLFLALKKKTRDHLVTSFLMFTAAALATPVVAAWEWALPLALFGACTWAMEGYLEKRRGRIYALPAILGWFAWTSVLWPLALAFVGSYLLQPRPEHPGLRRKLALIVAPSALIALVVEFVRVREGITDPWSLLPLEAWSLGLVGLVAVPAALALIVYWNRLASPHRIHGTLFLLIGPLDERFAAMFGMSAAIVLAATVFRQSVDSHRWRGAFKRAEWYYFWVLAGVAVFLALRKFGA